MTIASYPACWRCDNQVEGLDYCPAHDGELAGHSTHTYMLNLTPHPIILRASDGTDHVIPPSGHVARVSSTPGRLETVPGIPVPVASPTMYGEVAGLPDDGLLLVSAMVGAALRAYDDPRLYRCLCPGTGPNDGAIRDDSGRIVAVTRLVRP